MYLFFFLLIIYKSVDFQMFLINIISLFFKLNEQYSCARKNFRINDNETISGEINK